MEYIIILKNETNESIKKFNEIKKWFCNNLSIKKKYFYEDNINLTKNNFLISPNVFPLLNSLPLESIPGSENNFIINNSENYIGNIQLENNYKKIKFNDFTSILSNQSKNGELLKYFQEKLYLSKSWFFLLDNDIPNFLHYLEHKYFTWSRLNWIKLTISNKFPNIIYYEGKNKLESKKLIHTLKINSPKTYYVFNNVDEITKEIIDKLPDCIIKPTNLDGSKLIFKKTSSDFDLSILKEKIKNFDSIAKNKELMPMISAIHKPKIIAEEYIPDLNGNLTKPCEFKFYVFNGKILFFLAINRNLDYNKFDFYDEDFRQIPNDKLSYQRTQINYGWPKLNYFDDLKKDVYKIYNRFTIDMDFSLSSRFIRIDFFITKDKYYFGEFSLFPNGGSGKNLNDFGRKYFVQCWVPEVFSIFQNSPLILPKLTVKDIDEKLISDQKSLFRFNNQKKLINFLFS